MQTAANCCEGLGIPPEKWTVTCIVGEVSPELHDMGSLLNWMLLSSWQPWTRHACLLMSFSCLVVQFLNPGILVKKPAKIPEGHINSWFWERGSLKDDLPLKLPEGVCQSTLKQ